MQVATGGFGARGESIALQWPVHTTCIFLCCAAVLRACLEQKHGTGPCTGTNSALEKPLNEKRYYKHYFCSNTCVDVSWEELLKTMSWNDAKLMWEQNQTVCVMHSGSLFSGSLLILSQLFKICAVPLTSLEFMRVHVHFTDSASRGV